MQARPWQHVALLAALLGMALTGLSCHAQQPVRGGTLRFMAVPESVTVVAIDNSFGFPQKVGTKMVGPAGL
ncbi:MAG: transporter substrate-binding protein [Rhodoferax sp.]|nr:transporter substrate-binding protein [Rhodoferax sp.]